MGISVHSFIGYRIPSIADILSPRQLIWNDTSEGARRERLHLVNGCEVA
jgi:hypothetical protein